MKGLESLAAVIQEALAEAALLDIPQEKWPLAIARKLVDTGTVKLADHANVVRATIGGREMKVRIAGFDQARCLLQYEAVDGRAMGYIPIAAVIAEDNGKLFDIIGNVGPRPTGQQVPMNWQSGKVSLGSLQGKSEGAD